MVLKAVDQGRAVHSPTAGVDGDELAEEWSSEELSSAALLASSVLAKHGTGQVSLARGSCHVSFRLQTMQSSLCTSQPSGYVAVFICCRAVNVPY